jgi:hypothetical protein
MNEKAVASQSRVPDYAVVAVVVVALVASVMLFWGVLGG